MEQSRAALQAADANLTSAGADFQRAKVDAEGPDVPLLKRAYDRALGMAKDGVVSQSALDDADKNYKMALNKQNVAKAQVTVLQAKIEQAQAQVAQDRANLQQLEEQLGYTDIESPIDGVILSRDVEMGDAVSSILVLGSSATLVMTLGDTSQVYVKGKVDESDIGKVYLGQAGAHQGGIVQGQDFQWRGHQDFSDGGGKGQRHHLRGTGFDQQSGRRVEGGDDRECGNHSGRTPEGAADSRRRNHVRQRQEGFGRCARPQRERRHAEGGGQHWHFERGQDRSSLRAEGRRPGGAAVGAADWPPLSLRGNGLVGGTDHDPWGTCFAAPGYLATAMNFTEILRQTFAMFRAHKMRMFLTMFGIVWGISSVILLVGLGRGFSADNQRRMKTLGKDLVIVWGGRTSAQAGGLAAGREIRLVIDDARMIRSECYLVKTVSPELRRGVPEVSPFNSANREVVGMWPSYQDFRSLTVAEGRPVSDEDESEARRVVVLGDAARKQLFSGQPAVGASILIQRVPYTVIGVLQEKKQNSSYSGPG